jgi:LPXTG-motif cell wall-anchored protein
MNEKSLGNLGIRSALTMVAVLLIALMFATTARAQSPSDVQYDRPTDAGTAAVNSADFPSGGSGSDSAAAPASNGSGAGALLSVLPSTGGSQVFVLALGTLALGATGLLVLNRARR